MEESKEKELSVSTAEEADLIEGHLIPTTNEESVFYTTMEGYTMDVHRTMQATDNTTSESPPFAEGDHAPSDNALHTLTPFRGFVPVYTPSMVRMPLTITPEEIATLTKSPREDEPPMEKKDELPSTPTSSKAKGDSSPSPSPSPSQESEKTGHKRKRSDQSAAEVGSIMEDMRQAGAQDGITSTSASTQRPLGEGEAAFLSLVMQAANSEPIDDMSTEPTASLPDQLLESFIVRAHAMKDSSSSSDDGLGGVGKKRKFDEEGDLNELHDDKTANMKEYSGLKMLRKTRSDALEGLSSLSREGSWSDDGDGDGGDSVSVQGSNYAAEEGDRAMTDANPSALKRRPGRPPLKKESGDRRFEEWGQAEPVRRPPGRRGPGRPPKKQVSGGSEELFSFNEESLEGEKRDERGRGVGGRGVGSEDQRELEDADDEEGAAMMLESSDDGGGGKQRRRRNAAGVQTRRGDGARSFDNEDHELAWQERKDEESANDWRRRASMKGTANGGSRADERIADEWNSDQEEDEEEEEEDDDEDEWHDDEEDESWVDVSSDGENEITPEDDEEEAAVVAELKAAEEIRAVAEVMRREEEDLRRAIAASMAMTAAAPGASMDDHQMVLSEPMPDNPERAAVKVEPWVPAKTETPLTLRRLRPPWLDAFQEFQARGISLEECKAEVEHTWQSFLAEGTDKRAWTKVPPTVTAWEGIVEFVQERARETQEEEDRERKERREKRKKELEQLAEDAKRAKEENAEEEEDNNEEEEEMEDGGDEEDERDDDDEEDEEIDGDDGDEDDGDDRRRSLYQRRTRSGGRKAGGRTKKKRDMVAQLLDCFKEKDLEKVLVVNAAARKRKPPRKYGIDEWYNRG